MITRLSNKNISKQSSKMQYSLYFSTYWKKDITLIFFLFSLKLKKGTEKKI